MSAWSYFVRTPTETGMEQRRSGPNFTGRDEYKAIGPPKRVEPPSLLRGVRYALRAASRLLYVTPVLVVVKLVFWAMGDARGDLVIVPFVVVVLAFFVTLIVFVFGTAAWWIASDGAGVLTLSPPFSSAGAPLEEDAPEALPGALDAPVGARVCVSGTVTRLAPDQDDVIVRDFWGHGEEPWRGTMIAPFAVRVDGREDALVVVQCRQRSPLVIARPREVNATAFLDSLDAGARGAFAQLGGKPHGARGRASEGPLVEVREGDTVEVMGIVASRFDNLRALDLGLAIPEARSGYREVSAVHGVVIGDLGEWTLRIAVTSQRNSST
jgi:hypothetical protein